MLNRLATAFYLTIKSIIEQSYRLFFILQNILKFVIMEQIKVGYPYIDTLVADITYANGTSFPTPIDAVALVGLFPDIYWIEANALGQDVLCRAINEGTCPKIQTLSGNYEPKPFEWQQVGFFGGRPSKPPTK